MKAEGHLDRCFFTGAAGDAANAILSAVGFYLGLICLAEDTFAPHPDRFMQRSR